ncbi:MAG: TonB-dependent receptor [Bacteroidales bacterium]|nr:TonB-dependent receptor [Bacteroidales bacterium]
MHHALYIIAFFGFLPTILFGQFTISGKISDAETGDPLAGAHIVLESTYKSTISSAKGQFKITGLKTGDYLLKASFMGYEKYLKEIKLKQDMVIDIQLTPGAIMASEVIVTATRADASTPATFSTVTRQDIEQINMGQDMPYLLQTSPSVVTTSDAGTGIGYSSLRIRGTDLTRINVTINGIPLNDSESHGVWWVDLPDFASSAESIQIQRGVGTSTNGAAAFGASINIRTDDPEPDPYAELSASAGSFNTSKLTLRGGTGLINGKWAFDGRFSRIASDGYIDRASADLTSGAFSGGYFGKKNIIRLLVITGKEKTYQAWDGVPGYMLDSNRTYNGLGAYYDAHGNLQYYDDQTDNYLQTHYHLNWLNQVSGNWSLSSALHYTRGKGYYEGYKMDQDFSGYQLDDVIIGTDTVSSTDLVRRRFLDNHFYGFTFGLNYDNHRNITGNIGGAINYYDGLHYGEVTWARLALQFDKDYRWYENTGEKADANLFVKLNYRIGEKINAYGDLQYRFIDYRIEGIDNDLRDISQGHRYHFFNPKFGLLYEMNDHSQAYLSFGVGNREPNRSTLVDASPARPYPTAETLYNAEAGYRISGKKHLFQANIYYMYYRDQLVLTGKINDVGDPVMENVDRSYRAGIELSFGWHILKNLKWKANATLSSNKITDFVEYVDNWDEWPEQVVNEVGSTDIAFSPFLVAGSILAWEPVRNFEISLFSKYVGKQYIDNTASEERKLDPYFVNDLMFRYNMHFKTLKQLGFSLKINNITNTKYESNAWVYRYYSEGSYGVYDGYFPQAGIHFMVGVDLKF